jgi:hypothetical protein
MNIVASNILIDNFSSLENARQKSDEQQAIQNQRGSSNATFSTFKQSLCDVFNGVMARK